MMPAPSATTPSRTNSPDEQQWTRSRAVRSLTAHLILWGVAGTVLALDLWSKHWAFQALGSNEKRQIIPGLLEFRRSLNAGAVFGSFIGYTELFIVASLFALGFVAYLFARSDRHQRVLHLALALILAGAIGNLFDRAFVKADVVTTTGGNGRESVIIGKIISEPGADVVRIGDWPDGVNAQARDHSNVTIRRQGVVRDFVKIVPEFPHWVPKLAGHDVWPWVFNVADAALVCGVGVLLLSTWFDGRREEQIVRSEAVNVDLRSPDL